MSLSTAIYSGLSGLNSYGEAMSVVGDNIANLNTTGFKYSAVHFEDLMSQLIPTGSGPGQDAAGEDTEGEIETSRAVAGGEFPHRAPRPGCG